MNKVQSSLELLKIMATKFTEEANKLNINLEKDEEIKNQIS
tara:strand:+ start:2137 stop:2259 length:123 start_codon:yes stop_codon:yes gene_type:complete